MSKKANCRKCSLGKSKNIWKVLLFVLITILLIEFPSGDIVQAQETITFSGAELLGRPTDSSITIKIVPDDDIDYYYEYGTSAGEYTHQTSIISAVGSEPSQITLTGLNPDSKYYYRMQYNHGNTGWISRSEHTFWTQRAKGASFTFTISSDSHVGIMLGNAATWTQTMTNVAADHPDFHIDLGDTFPMDNVTSLTTADANYLGQREYFDLVGPSASIFLALGNHEQTEGWHRDDTGSVSTSPPVMSTNMMKKYYLNPVPDDFYTGNDETFAFIDGDGLLEDYFAWEWGDALFVFIDPFWYTTSKPFTGDMGGGETSDVGTGDRWDWTLGQDQFDWLKQTLENSNASYKFIFAHHMVGGSDDYVRGGANPAHIVEWGGNNENGTTWGWDTERSGWGEDPIHQILVDNQVSAFIHGHDHQYAYEKRDGVVYLSMPAAGFDGNGFGIYSTNSGYTIQALPSPGHVRVTVTPNLATMAYISTNDGQIDYSFDIEPSEAPDAILGDVNHDNKVDSTDALIILSADVGMNTTQHCPMSCGDVDGSGTVTSTDALVILSFNVGMTIPYPGVGLVGCPDGVTDPLGCSVPEQ